MVERSIGMGMSVPARFLTIAALLMLSGCGSPSSPARPTTTSTPTPSVVTAPPPTPTPTQTATPAPAPTPAVLTAASIHPESVTFISPDDGWVLGLSECGHVTCLRLAKTADAGRTWTWVSSDNLSTIAVADQWQLRFADSEDGWISGPRLYSTHDAGRTWTRVSVPGLVGPNSSVSALAAADGRVYAEITEALDANTNGPVVLFGSQTNVDAWYSVPSVSTGANGYAGNISVAQGVVWLSLHPAIVTADGNESLSTLYRSLDGVNWRSDQQPCPPGTVATVGAATSTCVFVVCSGGLAAGSQSKNAYVSENDGATYERVTDPPFDGDFNDLEASPISVSVVASSGASEIDTSFDNGHTWTTTLGIGDGGLGFTDVGFTTSTQGVAIHGRIDYPDSLQLFMTRDGGHHWAAVAVNPS